MKRELLLGAGRNLRKKITIAGAEDWANLTTLDFNAGHCPDIVADLEELPYRWAEDDAYDEIHAYEVMEHCGRQGDWRFFFAQWSEFGGCCEPGGLFCGTSPGASHASGCGEIRGIPAPSRPRASCFSPAEICGSREISR